MNKLQEILETYPDFMNWDLPHCIDCALQDGDDKKKAFIRVMPSIFKIENVDHFRKSSGCYYDARYSLKDGVDLPTGPGLKALVDLLKKHVPSNAAIVDDKILLPKYIVISYAVYCRCMKLDFEVTAQRSDVQVIQETFQTLKVDAEDI